MKLEDDPTFQDFISNRDLRESTINNYSMVLKSYSQYTRLSLEQLIDEAELEEEQAIKLRKRKIKQYLMGFKKYMEERGYSPVNIKNRITTVRTFYNEFEIQLPKQKNKTIKQLQQLEDLPCKEDIIHTLKFADLKYRAIILLMACSGMGESEICNLKFSDFLKSIETYVKGVRNIGEIIDILKRKVSNNELLIAEWHITRFKTDVQYTTFSTYESVEAILLYLKSYPIEDINDYLFRTRGKNKQLNIKVFNNYFYTLNFKAGYSYLGRQIFFRSHNLRKYFTNTLYQNKIREFNIKWMLGRKIGSTDERYFKTNIEDLKEDYIECIQDLSMLTNVKVHDIKSPEFIKIEERLDELTAIIKGDESLKHQIDLDKK